MSPTFKSPSPNTVDKVSKLLRDWMLDLDWTRGEGRGKGEKKLLEDTAELRGRGT